jgi:hypothetical protein
MGKPLMFDGSSSDYWKRNMSTYVISMNIKIWDVVENDFVVIDPTNSTAREEEKLHSMILPSISCMRLCEGV